MFHHRETSQLICFENQRNGFYMVEALVFRWVSIFLHKYYPAGKYMLTVIDKKN